MNFTKQEIADMIDASHNAKITRLEAQLAEEHEAHGEAMNRAFADFQKVQQVLAESQSREYVLRSALEPCTDYINNAIAERMQTLGETYRPHVIKVMREDLENAEKALKMPYDGAELKVAMDLSYRKGVEGYIDAVRQAKKEALLKAMEWFYEDEQYEPASSLRRMAKDYE